MTALGFQGSDGSFRSINNLNTGSHTHTHTPDNLVCILVLLIHKGVIKTVVTACGYTSGVLRWRLAAAEGPEQRRTATRQRQRRTFAVLNTTNVLFSPDA